MCKSHPLSHPLTTLVIKHLKGKPSQSISSPKRFLILMRDVVQGGGGSQAPIIVAHYQDKWLVSLHQVIHTLKGHS